MTAVEQLHFDFMEFRHHPFLGRLAPDRESAVVDSDGVPVKRENLSAVWLLR
jgi:hypothetical protein